MKQNQPVHALGNALVLPEGTMTPVFPAGTMPLMPPMPLMHLDFGTRPTFYMPHVALIRKLDDMLSSPLRQHILDYEPPRGFVIPAFTTFDGSIDPYHHTFHYNQTMILNADNDHFFV